MKLKKNLSMLILAACSTIASTAVIAVEAPRPNILLILADDLGYADVGFTGGKDIPTASIDSLAEGGTIFTSAYTAHNFCGPSRAALMTGRYPQVIGAPLNLEPDSYIRNEGVDTNETFISKVLQDAGYYTGVIGKWHLGDNPQYTPNNRGYDYFYGFLGGGHDYIPRVWNPKLNGGQGAYRGGYEQAYNNQLKQGKEEWEISEYKRTLLRNEEKVQAETLHLTDEFTLQANRFIERAADKDEPFFLYLSYNAPHTPLTPKAEDRALFDHLKSDYRKELSGNRTETAEERQARFDGYDEDRRNFAGLVYGLDRGIGEVINTLKSTGQFNNTLIVFLSDNGGKIAKGGANNKPLTGGKGDVTEGGFRVPMFMHWPDQVKAGEQFDNVVSALDLYPTFANLAGATIPVNKKLDGINVFGDYLNGTDTRANYNRMIYVLRHHGGYHNVGARKGKWKAVKVSRGNTKPWALYDMNKDIGETTDVSAKYPKILRNIVSRTEKWSRTHVEPEFFHTKKFTQLWAEYNMPVYEETFQMLK